MPLSILHKNHKEYFKGANGRYVWGGAAYETVGVKCTCHILEEIAETYEDKF